ncbi:MAG: phosphate ABC transporter permease subunit PstC [Glaciecola sp.]|jgi:phosphate transport system permease protein
MSTSSLALVIIGIALVSYYLGLQRAIKVAGGRQKVRDLVSLPSHYGLLTAFWCGLPALLFLLLWSAIEGTVIDALLLQHITATSEFVADQNNSLSINNIKIYAERLLLAQDVSAATVLELQHAEYFIALSNKAVWLKTLLTIVIAVGCVATILAKIKHAFHARNNLERIISVLLFCCSAIALLTTIGIVMSVLFESIAFFAKVPVTEFLFGTQWSPQIAMRADQVGGSGAFGAIPLFVGTILISTIAMFLAIPVGLMIAIYLSQYASQRLRSIAKPMLEILAGVPTVVYGFFAALTVAPLIRDFGIMIDLPIAAESALAAGLVMGIMIIPFVSSLSEDALTAVPTALRDGSLGMGATPSETIKKVLLPAAIPGIVGAILLAISRAIGETMIVVMAAGLAANLTFNPIESVTTVTVQIVSLLKGDQEFDSAKTLAAFALGLMLFITTLALNVAALKIVRKYREQYD